MAQGWADTLLKVGGPVGLVGTAIAWVYRQFESREKMNAQQLDAQQKREDAQADRNDRENERIIADLRRDREDRDRIIAQKDETMGKMQGRIDGQVAHIDRLVRERDYSVRVEQWYALVAQGATFYARRVAHDANGRIGALAQRLELASKLLPATERQRITTPDFKDFERPPDDEILAGRAKPKPPEGVQEAV